MRTSSRATSRKRSASHAPRADSPNGGAGIRAISICHCASCGSCVRSQLNADRTSGEAASRATSCCTVGATSGISARGGVGLMGVYCVILQRMGRNRDYLGREPDAAVAVLDLPTRADENWTFVTFATTKSGCPISRVLCEKWGFSPPPTASVFPISRKDGTDTHPHFSTVECDI